MPRPQSKIRKFPVGAAWPTVADAHAAAVAHRDNDMEPQFATAVVRDPAVDSPGEGLASGIELGVLTTNVQPPTGALDVVFDSSWWNAPPT